MLAYFQSQRGRWVALAVGTLLLTSVAPAQTPLRGPPLSQRPTGTTLSVAGQTVVVPNISQPLMPPQPHNGPLNNGSLGDFQTGPGNNFGFTIPPQQGGNGFGGGGFGGGGFGGGGFSGFGGGGFSGGFGGGGFSGGFGGGGFSGFGGGGFGGGGFGGGGFGGGGFGGFSQGTNPTGGFFGFGGNFAGFGGASGGALGGF